jgi:hypothetical protein
MAEGIGTLGASEIVVWGQKIVLQGAAELQSSWKVSGSAQHASCSPPGSRRRTEINMARQTCSALKRVVKGKCSNDDMSFHVEGQGRG